MFAKKRQKKSSSLRPSTEDEQVATTKKNRADGRKMVFAPRDDAATVLEKRAGVRGLLAWVRSTRCNTCKEFLNRVFTAAINIR
jgi:NMD protein affecting ribosome stability and mRNA decay